MVILMEMMLDVVMGVMDMEVEKVANIMVNKFPIFPSGKIVKKVKE